MGYSRAGFEVVGVDIAPQPNYPFEFHQGDALEFLAEHGREFDLIHASPPCQKYSSLTLGTNQGRQYAALLPETRNKLAGIGRPSIIENVMSQDIRRDLVLCGEYFGLKVIRHRAFELGRWTTSQPAHQKHRGRVAGCRHGKWFDGPYFAVYGCGGGKGSVAQWKDAMGIDWMTERKELSEAIPPAYAEFVGMAYQEALTLQ